MPFFSDKILLIFAGVVGLWTSHHIRKCKSQILSHQIFSSAITEVMEMPEKFMV